MSRSYKVSWTHIFLGAGLTSFALATCAPAYSFHGSYVKTFAVVLPACIGLWIIFKAIIYPTFLSPLRHLPQAPGGSFWHGHFAQVSKEDSGAPMKGWINTVPNDGMIRYKMLFNAERVLLTSPKTLSEVLVTQSYSFNKPALAAAGLGRILGVGVLLAEGEEHKQQRKHLMPAFAYRHIKDLVPLFWSKSTELIREFQSKVPDVATSEAGSIVMFSDWVARATLDIIGVAGMGFDFGAIYNPSTELNVAYRAVFTPSSQAKMLALLSAIFPIFLLRLIPLKRNSDMRAAAAVVRDTARSLIHEKKAKLAAAAAAGEKLPANEGKDILSVLIQSGGFTEENMVDQIMTFLAAGHETTSSAMAWALAALAQRPELQERLRSEVRANLPSPDDADAVVTAKMIDKNPLLHAGKQRRRGEQLRQHDILAW